MRWDVDFFKGEGGGPVEFLLVGGGVSFEGGEGKEGMGWGGFTSKRSAMRGWERWM